jgi:hypothetical protein
MKLASWRLVGGAVMALALAACASTAIQTGGPRPPQGPGPAGTNFGFWDRDAEGSVDQDFRQSIARTWRGGQEAEARKVFEADGFACKDGNRPEATAVPNLECERVFSEDDNVHSWTVRFWPNQPRAEAHYVRLHMRDPLKNYDEKKAKNH